MDSLSHEKQIEYAGQLLRDEARSGSAQQCHVVLTVASEIVSGAIQNGNIPTSAHPELNAAQRNLGDALTEIEADQAGAA